MAKTQEQVEQQLAEVLEQLKRELDGRDRRGGNLMGMVRAFLFGAAVGAGLALIYAPQSGVATRLQLRERRDELMDRASQVADQAREQASTVQEQAQQTLNQAKERAQTLSNTAPDKAEKVQNIAAQTKGASSGEHRPADRA